MKALWRRLQRLESVFAPPDHVPRVAAVALKTGGDDLVLVDGEWQTCPDAAAVLDRHDGLLKVYAGFDPREVTACPSRD